MIQLTDKDEEISELLDKISDQQKDYQSLQETKAALDTEIAVFRQLMETEEDRMGLSETGGEEICKSDLTLDLSCFSWEIRINDTRFVQDREGRNPAFKDGSNNFIMDMDL